MHLAERASRHANQVEEALLWLQSVEDRPIRDLRNAFIGALGTNSEWFSNFVRFAANETSQRRDPLAPPSPFDLQESDFERQCNLLHVLTQRLVADSIPFSSNGYWAHMNWDTLMVSMAAIVATLPLNPNQVAAEGSPVTTALELKVAEQLCEMLGYSPQAKPGPWGHLTSDGSVANIEALWMARNLKLYPTAVAEAIDRHLKKAKRVTVRWRGTETPLVSLGKWQLLNLSADETLDLPGRLLEFCEEPELRVIRKYTVQHLGLLRFAQRFGRALLTGLDCLAPATAHYSLPKGSSLLGLGDVGLVRVPVDAVFRMDLGRLNRLLDKRLRQKRPVLAVIAVIGNTEHGALDPLREIIDLRESYRAKGLDFHVHADAAYGGYFASMLRSGLESPIGNSVLGRHAHNELQALADADSVTIDPHKSGYVPYPAGAICYRDKRMPEMVAYRAPVVFHSGQYPSVGSFGVEGSRPGTAAAAVWVAHKSIPLNQSGYGRLHGDAIRSSRLVRDRLTSMAGGEPFTITMLFDDEDQDLNIMSYAFNLRGNSLVGKANQLNDAIYDRLAIEYEGDLKPPVIITGSKLDPADYTARFVRKVCERIGLKHDGSPLSFLISTIMNPFLDEGIVDDLVEGMKGIIIEECENVRASSS